MKYALVLATALVAGATLVTSGCSVIRGQETVGSYVDDTAITTAVGPDTGGWLSDHVRWRAVFFLNLPLALIVVVLSLH